MRAPENRVRALNELPVSPKGKFVLYWMTSARRPLYNFGLEHAVALAKQYKVPLLVLEALRVAYPWASVRLHDFVLAGMADNLAHFVKTNAIYYPYLEPTPGAGSGLLAALSESASAIVADDYPAFFLPHMVSAAAAKVAVRMEAVDSNGLLPISAADGRTFQTAYSFRRFLQQQLPSELGRVPQKDPLKGVALAPLEKLPAGIAKRWPALTQTKLQRRAALLAQLPLDQDVQAVTLYQGGFVRGAKEVRSFIKQRLPQYSDGRSHPDSGASSGLSPWLHFGHVSSHQILAELMKAEDWDGHPRGKTRNGTREGFWGLSAAAEAFLDELVTWRELGFNTCAALENYADYDSLPVWARETLEAHAKDPREPRYTLRCAREGRDLRRGLECRTARALARRSHSQLSAHALGQEDPRVDQEPTRSTRGDDPPQQQVRRGRARPELVLRHLLGTRALRPTMGAETPRFRQHPLHEQRGRPTQATHAQISRALWS